MATIILDRRIGSICQGMTGDTSRHAVRPDEVLRDLRGRNVRKPVVEIDSGMDNSIRDLVPASQ
jgi:hypothetical protein